MVAKKTWALILLMTFVNSISASTYENIQGDEITTKYTNGSYFISLNDIVEQSSGCDYKKDVFCFHSRFLSFNFIKSFLPKNEGENVEILGDSQELYTISMQKIFFNGDEFFGYKIVADWRNVNSFINKGRFLIYYSEDRGILSFQQIGEDFILPAWILKSEKGLFGEIN
jgi:hypothetical protein